MKSMMVARLLLLLSCSIFPPVSRAYGFELPITAKAAVLMEKRTGKIVWQRNPNLSLAPASTTKILTAFVVLEGGNPGNSVRVPAEATKATGGTVHLRTGERLSVEQLVYGMMLGSANDAAIALARHTGGSVTRFVDLMNTKARGLGAQHSRFLNPTGLPQKGHVTAARDLALITRAALNNPAFRRIVATKNYFWQSAQWSGELKNSNLLLDDYPGAIGVKTGQTREAGFCLVAAAARGEESFIAVILKSAEASVWNDAKTLLDYGFGKADSRKNPS
jgi:D-alanyl-D-alanine carboxypeptidase (penicillin-binding protein 5/6)